MLENASEVFDRDPTVIVSRHFIMLDHMASSKRSIDDPTVAM